MTQEPEWKKEFKKDFTRKNFLDRLHLSVNELSELGAAWLISSLVILVITGDLSQIIQQGRIPTNLLIFLFIFGLSFFVHELFHKFTAIKFGARAYFRLVKEALMLMLVSLIIGFPLLATGAVFWFGEATASPGIRGRVSLAGPLSNLTLAGFFLIIEGFGVMIYPQAFDLGLILIYSGRLGVSLNAFLGIFNLLPIGLLDGAKVLAWDPKIWVSVIGSLVIIVLIFGGGGFFI